MNNYLRLPIFGIALVFGLQGSAIAEGDGVYVEKTLEEITEICEKEAENKEDENAEEDIYLCIDEYVEKQRQQSEDIENSPAE